MISRHMRPVAFAVALAALSLSRALPVDAADPPYLKLAQALGTPKLVSSVGARDKSQLGLTFVRANESLGHWTKMTTVSILKVPEADTESAKLGVIARLHAKIQSLGARVKRFDVTKAAPANAYFAYAAKSDTDAGFVYSPQAGYVTVAQLQTKPGASISARDVTALQNVARGLLP